MYEHVRSAYDFRLKDRALLTARGTKNISVRLETPLPLQVLETKAVALGYVGLAAGVTGACPESAGQCTPTQDTGQHHLEN